MTIRLVRIRPWVEPRVISKALNIALDSVISRPDAGKSFDYGPVL